MTAFAFVHHANQLVICDGYENRDGISRICEGYEAILDLHEAFALPATLHLSGTLIESLAWHRPSLLRRIRALVAEGLVSLIGGTYAEPIMPALTPGLNRRHIETMARIAEQHLGIADGAFDTAWLPERVWDPALQAVLTDPRLPGGGFKRVLIDDRLLADASLTAVARRDSRGTADLRGPYQWDLRSAQPTPEAFIDPGLLAPVSLDGDAPLDCVPISSHLRYLIPPSTDEKFAVLKRTLEHVSRDVSDPDSLLLVFADDLERTAGVAGWGEPTFDAYERMLRWMSTEAPVNVVHLDQWLDCHPPRLRRTPIAAGAYFELEVGWSAGPGLRQWQAAPEWAPYRRLLADAEASLDAVREVSGAAPHEASLVELCERLLMQGTHETAWRDEGGRLLAPWARACASHVRLITPLLAAAEWAAGPPQAEPSAGLLDIDSDGEQELLLSGDSVWALISPSNGARVTALVHRNPGADGAVSRPALICGNPLDHWNFQEELHRFTETPVMHPGAMADSLPHAAWSATVDRWTPEAVVVGMRRLGHPVGVRRRYGVIAGIPGLALCLGGIDADGPRIFSGVIPDYMTSINQGGAAIRACAGKGWTGWRDGERIVWIAFDPAEATPIDTPTPGTAHFLPIELHIADGHADLILGAGAADGDQAAAWLAAVRDHLHF